MEECHSTLDFDGIGRVLIEYEDGDHLPAALGNNSQDGVAAVNLVGILDEDNANLTPAPNFFFSCTVTLVTRMSRMQNLFCFFPSSLRNSKSLVAVISLCVHLVDFLKHTAFLLKVQLRYCISKSVVSSMLTTFVQVVWCQWITLILTSMVVRFLLEVA